ncbi:hypothetical protein ACIHEJ_34300 [Streptomyces sp. NPDC052301]
MTETELPPPDPAGTTVPPSRAPLDRYARWTGLLVGALAADARTSQG